MHRRCYEQTDSKEDEEGKGWKSIEASSWKTRTSIPKTRTRRGRKGYKSVVVNLCFIVIIALNALSIADEGRGVRPAVQWRAREPRMYSAQVMSAYLYCEREHDFRWIDIRKNNRLSQVDLVVMMALLFSPREGYGGLVRTHTDAQVFRNSDGRRVCSVLSRNSAPTKKKKTNLNEVQRRLISRRDG